MTRRGQRTNDTKMGEWHIEQHTLNWRGTHIELRGLMTQDRRHVEWGGNDCIMEDTVRREGITRAEGGDHES